MLRKFPEVFEPLFVGEKNPAKFPLNLLLNSPQKYSPTSFCRSAGRIFEPPLSLFCRRFRRRFSFSQFCGKSAQKSPPSKSRQNFPKFSQQNPRHISADRPSQFLEEGKRPPTPKTRFNIWTLLRTPSRFTTRPLVHFTHKNVHSKAVFSP